jgi:hypothetical protein
MNSDQLMRMAIGLTTAFIIFLGTEIVDIHDRLIILNTKMTLLVTPQMEIVGSKKVDFHEIRINGIEKDLYK